MKEIPLDQVHRRLQAENIWWAGSQQINESYRSLRRRAYFDLLYPLVSRFDVRRAVLLMGPRRVGKTVLIHQVIQQLLADGIDARRICYVSVDHPIYNNLGLLDLIDRYADAAGVELHGDDLFVFFDEVQYVKEWEIHLKVLVDTFPRIRFVASGSAAAALRLKSIESGAGRFTDFLLPPLTFFEYLELLDRTGLIAGTSDTAFPDAPDIAALNVAFVHYLNFGGYPEVLFSEEIQSDPARFIKGDIIDKVLLRDLPGLYGIQDIQELNYLFTTLAFNTANEISLEQLSQSSGVAKNTIKRYIEYLEAAFLIRLLHRVDRSTKRFQRANFFKVYLTNPSMRAALFAPVSEADEAMGDVVETGIFSQWFHSGRVALHYSRWKDGEVDIVDVGPDVKAKWAVEVKWSDKPFDNPSTLKSVIGFCHQNGLAEVVVTTKTRSGRKTVAGVEMTFVPSAIYCYAVGRDIISFPHQVTKILGKAESPRPSPERAATAPPNLR